MSKPALFRFQFFSVLPALLVLVGCGSKSTEKSSLTSPLELVNADRSDLRSNNRVGYEIYDVQSGGRFSRFFGGTSASQLGAYLDARLHYYFDPSDSEIDASPSDILNQNWLMDVSTPPNQGRTVLRAVNVGLLFWIAGQTANEAVTFFLHGQSIPVDSPRVGIMMIGEGYDARLPIEFRQSILLHEARHSDCVGGLSSADVSRLRLARSATEANPIIGEIRCGHMHVDCPKGHDLEGLPACDPEAWGAYTAGELYLRGVREDPGLTRRNRAIIDAAIIDAASRVLVTRSGMPEP